MVLDTEVEEMEVSYTKQITYISYIPQNKLLKFNFQEKKNEDFLRKAVKKKKDDADIFAEGWTLSFKKLSEVQKLYAKKGIDEILLFGQLNQLSLHNVTPSPICSNENSPFQLSSSSTKTISLVL